jgi:hypothetical protein
MYINIYPTEVSISTTIETDAYIKLSRDDLIPLFDLNAISEIRELNNEPITNILNAEDYASTMHNDFLYISYLDTTLFTVHLKKHVPNFYGYPVIFNY